jgi:hypothetical protein
MAKRTNDLTEAAQSVAEVLAQRTGSLKVVLSAGVIALSQLDADDREKAIATANGSAEAIDLYAAQRALAGIREELREITLAWRHQGLENPFSDKLSGLIATGLEQPTAEGVPAADEQLEAYAAAFVEVAQILEAGAKGKISAKAAISKAIERLGPTSEELDDQQRAEAGEVVDGAEDASKSHKRKRRPG